MNLRYFAVIVLLLAIVFGVYMSAQIYIRHGLAGFYYGISTILLKDSPPDVRTHLAFGSDNRKLLSRSLGYNNKCGRDPTLIISKSGHAKGVPNPHDVSIGEIHRFVKYRHWFENFYHDYLYRHFGLERGLYNQYSVFETEYHDIKNFELLRIVPPYAPFDALGYHNLTMGKLGIIPDVTNDGIPELMTKTSQEECSPDRIDVVVVGDSIRSSLEQGKTKLVIDDLVVNLNSYRSKEDFINDPAPVNPYRSSSECGILLHNGQALTLNKDNSAVVSHSFLEQFPENAVVITDKIMFLTKNGGYLELNEIDCISGTAHNFVLENGSEETILAKDIMKYEYRFSNDIDGDGKMEFSFFSPNALHLVLSSNHQLLSVVIPPKLNGYELNSVTEFGGQINLRADDGSVVTLNSIAFSHARNDGYPGGVVVLLDLNPIQKGSLEFEDLAYAVFLGSQKHILNPSSNGIGYSLSPVSADFDRDGIDDFLTVTHYEGAFNGAVYILSGKNIRRGSVIHTSDPNFIKIRGIPNSFLGTGLDASFDWDGDGVKDIVVGADVDHEAALGAGAIQILSGSIIGDHLINN